MLPVRTVYVPRFGSQLSSSQRTEPGPDRWVSSTHSQSDKCGKKRRKTRAEKAARSLLKVKLPQLKSRALTTTAPKDVKTPTKSILKPPSSKTKSTTNPEKQTEGANTTSPFLNGDVFSFTQRSSIQPSNGKEKAKLSVLRTISKMLEENRLIRQRLSSLRQAI